MQPTLWQPPIEPSPAEQTIIKRIRRAKLFVFLREQRHEIFNPAFQEELSGLYRDSKRGQPPIPPAQLALATLLQAYTGASDDEVIEASTMDRRWQLVLDCLDTQETPFSKGTLIGFRTRLIEANMDRRLIERTIEVANKTGGFGARPLRAALDSSPLWGASRVEDTYNLLGHALRKALGVIARQQGRELTEIARDANAMLVAGSSLKAALDRDWDDPTQCEQALGVVLTALAAVERWLETAPQGHDEPVVTFSMSAAEQVKEQDVQVSEQGSASLRKAVAKDRRIAIEDAQMRHGRKCRSVRVDGYKRHVLQDLDSGLVRAVGITAANAAEASVTDAIRADLACQHVQVSELHIDRAYLSSTWVRERPTDLDISCKAWPVRNGSRSPRRPFTWTGSSRPCAVPTSRRCPLPRETWCTFLLKSVAPAPCESVVPPAHRGVRSAFIRTSSCCGNYANGNSRPSDALNYGSGWRWNIRWHISDTGKDGVLAIEVSAKISLICVAAQSCTICISLLACLLKLSTPKQPDFLTGALVAERSGSRSTTRRNRSTRMVP